MVSSNSPESAAAPVSTYSVCSSYWYIQNIISSSSFYDLNFPPAGNPLYLPHRDTPIHRDLAHSHRSWDTDLEGSKGSILPATEHDRAMRHGIPAPFAHATAVRCRAVGRSPWSLLDGEAARGGGGAACEHYKVDIQIASISAFAD